MSILTCCCETNAAGRETLAHGTPGFPVACYQDELLTAQVPWHWHDELEAAVVTQGRVVFACGGEKHRLGPGEGFFVNAGVLHAVWCADGEQCQLRSVVFHPRLLCSGVECVYWQKYLQPLLVNAALKGRVLRSGDAWEQEALSLVERTWQLCAKEEGGYEFGVRSCLSDLVYGLISHSTSSPRGPSAKAQRDNERIKTMLHYMDNHLTRPLTVAQLAASAAISQSECLRCFRTTLGTSPIQYLKLLRLRRAAELLSSTDLKITLIGEQCGFQDMSYFAAAFLRARGCTPSAYRSRAAQK